MLNIVLHFNIIFMFNFNNEWNILKQYTKKAFGEGLVVLVVSAYTKIEKFLKIHYNTHWLYVFKI